MVPPSGFTSRPAPPYGPPPAPGTWPGAAPWPPGAPGGGPYGLAPGAGNPPGAWGGAPGPAGAGPPGGTTAPIDGGATPSMVPLSCGFGEMAGGAPPGAGPAPGAAGGAPGAGAGAPGRGAAGGAFIMSIVPLNFGAAAPFRLKPHFEHVVAVSGFCVPQFGQNTRGNLRAASIRRASPAYTPSLRFLKRSERDSGRSVQLGASLDTLDSSSLRCARPGRPIDSA